MQSPFTAALIPGVLVHSAPTVEGLCVDARALDDATRSVSITERCGSARCGGGAFAAPDASPEWRLGSARAQLEAR